MRRQVRVFEVKVKVGLQEEEEGNPDLGFANRKPSRTCYGLLGWIIPIDQSIFIKSLWGTPLKRKARPWRLGALVLSVELGFDTVA